jgi:hypothetical protein
MALANVRAGIQKFAQHPQCHRAVSRDDHDGMGSPVIHRQSWNAPGIPSDAPMPAPKAWINYGKSPRDHVRPSTSSAFACPAAPSPGPWVCDASPRIQVLAEHCFAGPAHGHVRTARNRATKRDIAETGKRCMMLKNFELVAGALGVRITKRLEDSPR